MLLHIGSQFILYKTCNWPKIFLLLETNILAEAAASNDGLPRWFNMWMDKHYQILHYFDCGKLAVS